MTGFMQNRIRWHECRHCWLLPVWNIFHASSIASIRIIRWTFLPVDDLGVNLSDFFRLDAQDDIVGLDGRDIFAIGISLRDRNGARLLELLL